VEEIALAIGRAEVDGRERRIEVDRIIDIVIVCIMMYNVKYKTEYYMYTIDHQSVSYYSDFCGIKHHRE
jgi:hypothetical protein